MLNTFKQKAALAAFAFIALLISPYTHAGKSVEAFISEQALIRVFSDSADGFGNQTASQNVIIRLRQMGYTGKFEFIYPTDATDKIVTLFDLPNHMPDTYFDAKSNIQFIKLSYYVNQYKSVEPITLGLTGVLAYKLCDMAEHDGANLENLDNGSCDNLASFAKAKAFIRLSPFISGSDHDYPSRDDTKISLPQQEDYTEINSDRKFIVMPVATLEQSKQYLEHDSRGIDLLKQKPALKTLIDGIDEHSFNVQPIYGYTLQIRDGCKDDTSNNCLYRKTSNMLQVIAGARYAQLHGPKTMQKPLIIPVFYAYEREATMLEQLINGNIWSTITEPGSEKIKLMLETLQLKKNYFTASLTDPDAANKITTLQNGQILLLSVGALPKVVFDGLYTHTSENVWPPVREGANSFNSLILTGRAHIRCGIDDGWEIGFDLVTDTELKQRLENFYSRFCRTNDDDGIASVIGEFVLAANNPDSSLSRYFTELKKQALKPENDRIHFAITDVIRILNE